jgi:hypothetical protein
MCLQCAVAMLPPAVRRRRVARTASPSHRGRRGGRRHCRVVAIGAGSVDPYAFPPPAQSVALRREAAKAVCRAEPPCRAPPGHGGGGNAGATGAYRGHRCQPSGSRCVPLLSNGRNCGASLRCRSPCCCAAVLQCAAPLDHRGAGNGLTLIGDRHIDLLLLWRWC